jgi:hypothetical protein
MQGAVYVLNTDKVNPLLIGTVIIKAIEYISRRNQPCRVIIEDLQWAEKYDSECRKKILEFYPEATFCRRWLDRRGGADWIYVDTLVRVYLRNEHNICEILNHEESLRKTVIAQPKRTKRNIFSRLVFWRRQAPDDSIYRVIECLPQSLRTQPRFFENFLLNVLQLYMLYVWCAMDIIGMWSPLRALCDNNPKVLICMPLSRQKTNQETDGLPKKRVTHKIGNKAPPTNVFALNLGTRYPPTIWMAISLGFMNFLSWLDTRNFVFNQEFSLSLRILWLILVFVKLADKICVFVIFWHMSKFIGLKDMYGFLVLGPAFYFGLSGYCFLICAILWMGMWILQKRNRSFQ